MAVPSDGQVPTTLNIPSIVAFAVISFFAIRYLFFTPATHANAPGAASQAARGARRVDPARIETILQMFPQMNRRDVEWDLIRNGGSVQATTDKILREGRLDTPPPNFRAQEPPQMPAAVPNSSSRRNGGSMQGQPRSNYADLITRYSLASRLTETGPDAEPSPAAAKGKGKEKAAWSANKTERQALLQRRREDMILAARRKLEDKDGAKR